MSMNIRYPNITGLSEREQVAQIKSFLHQLVDQLNYALPNAGSGSAASAQTVEVQGGNLSYYDLRSLIIQEIQELDTLFDNLSQNLRGEFVPTTGWEPDKRLATDSNGNVVAVEGDMDVEEAVNNALEQAKENGDFTGPAGPQGVGIENAVINGSGELVITYSNGDKVNLGKVTGDGYVDANTIATQAAEKIAITMDDNGDLYYEVITDGNTNNEVEE